jgi:hypothetical protein
MKKLALNFSGWICLLLLALASVSLVGCATSRADQENISERPWNAPTSWQQGGPMSSVMEGQR